MNVLLQEPYYEVGGVEDMEHMEYLTKFRPLTIIGIANLGGCGDYVIAADTNFCYRLGACIWNTWE